MKKAHELATILLWAIAIVATVLITGNSALLSYLGPLYAVCMIGSVIVVRRAKGSQDKLPVL